MVSLHKYSVFPFSNIEILIYFKHYDTLKTLVLLVCLVALSFQVFSFSPIRVSPFIFKAKVFASESPFSAPIWTTYQFEGVYVVCVCVFNPEAVVSCLSLKHR